MFNYMFTVSVVKTPSSDFRHGHHETRIWAKAKTIDARSVTSQIKSSIGLFKVSRFRKNDLPYTHVRSETCDYKTSLKNCKTKRAYNPINT
jgi:hypothetical protein